MPAQARRYRILSRRKAPEATESLERCGHLAARDPREHCKRALAAAD
jgi:hypothetical protein